MKEAIGGVFSLTLLMTFIVVISSIIAFSVSYSRALRMKEFVTTQFEKQECNINSDLKNAVRKEASRLGYDSSVGCSDIARDAHDVYEIDGVCIVVSSDAGGKSAVVVSYAGIDLPFIRDIFPILKFQVSGTTNKCRVFNAS